ncbi:twin-arginine translocation signal domain-containing protein [Eggerthella sinensis]|uniref:twin-arginine translocation signal domain-containing protein n=1 Tax=Eggerthella sinensis TaxID=242230 RepID=UPI0022E93ACA|nr:twin-arginine translocation signal domain-containing protein [Eggerthella sinensis]
MGRRNFLKGLAVGSVALAGAGLAGCAPKNADAASAQPGWLRAEERGRRVRATGFGHGAACVVGRRVRSAGCRLGLRGTCRGVRSQERRCRHEGHRENGHAGR